MVKRDQLERKKVRTICLDPSEPLAREYPWERADEQVTVPDTSPSLTYMVTTGNVGSMSSANRYTFTHAPETETDDDHDMPDYQRLKDVDLVEREEWSKELFEDLKSKHEEKRSEGLGTEKVQKDSDSGAPGKPGGEGTK